MATNDALEIVKRMQQGMTAGQALRPPQTFFPAAGSYIQGNSAGATPSVAALNRPIQDYGTPVAGTTRLGRGDLATYQLPSGGFASVQKGSRVPSYANLTQYGNQPNVTDRASQFNLGQAYARGYGAPPPTLQSGGLIQGGVYNPVENLSPQQRSQYGASTFLERAGQAIGGTQFALNRIGTLGYNAASGLASKFFPRQQSQQSYTYNPPPVPRQPNRYFDY